MSNEKIGLGNSVLDGSFLWDNPKRKGVLAQIAGLADSEDLKAHLIKAFGRNGLLLEEARPASII
jgi:hypothetical protein